MPPAPIHHLAAHSAALPGDALSGIIGYLAGINPTIAAALIGAFVAALGFWYAAHAAAKLQRQKAADDRALLERRREIDEGLGAARAEESLAAQRERSAFEGALARRRYDLERALFPAKRQVEIAEEVLGAAYHAAEAMRYARGRFTREGEGETRPPVAGEDESEKRSRDLTFVVIERINKAADAFATLQASAFRFAAYFGPEADDAMMKLLSARHHLQVLVSSLISLPFTSFQESTRRTFTQQLYGSDNHEEPDKIESLMAEGVAGIEHACKPVLSAEPKD